MFHEPGVFIKRLDSIFEKKNRACFGSIGARLWPQPGTLPLYYEGKAMKTIFTRNNAYVTKDNNNSPHGKFHRFLFLFSSKFCLICSPYLPMLCHLSHTVSLSDIPDKWSLPTRYWTLASFENFPSESQLDEAHSWIKDMNQRFCIYACGNVEAKLKEQCHEDFTVQFRAKIITLRL